MANNENLKKGVATQFRAGEEQAKIARKGGRASGPARRRKNAARRYLAEVMAYKPRMTSALRANLAQMGADPDLEEFTTEKLGMIALAQKVMKGDVRAIELYLSMFEEDPGTLIEKERLQVQKDAVEAIRNTDGFMEAMKGVAEEVFTVGGDTPDDIED